MARARLTIATSLALALLWAGAADAAPATAAGTSPGFAAIPAAVGTAAVSATAGTSGLSAGQRRARSRALKKCRRIGKKAKRKRCQRRVRQRFAKLAAKRDRPKPTPPAPTVKVYDVAVLDDYFDPDRIEIKRGEALRFVWGEHNKDAHNITLLSGPPGVDPLDFELSSAPSLGMTFQRTFTVAGTYRIACSLHHLQVIEVTVTA